MNREDAGRLIVAFAVIASMLVVSAPMEVAAMSSTATSDGLVVGSQHDTQSEFSNAQDLTNLTVSGSGSSAVVELSPAVDVYDGFEDGDVSEWSGDTSNFNAQTNVVASGSYAGAYAGSSSVSRSLPQSYTGTVKLSHKVRFTNVNDGNTDFIRHTDGGTEVTNFAVYDGYLQYYTGSQWVQITSVSNNQWYTIRTDIHTDTDTVDVYVDGTLEASDLTLYNAASAVDGINLQGQSSSDTMYVDDLGISKGSPTSARYESAIHQVSNGAEAAINVTAITNVSVEVTVRTDGGTVLNQSTITSVGNHTLALADTTSSDLETILNVDKTGDDPSFELSDESILFSNHSPEASNPSPADGTNLDDKQVNFSVDVSDPEFPTAQGDSVTAELVLDGSTEYTETVTSNSTVSTTETLSTGGSHDYYWNLTDEYGATTTTSTRTIHVPSELSFYNETSPESLVTEVNVTARFFGSDTIVTRTSSDGVVNMTGLPADEQILVTANADGYYQRTVTLDSLYDQQSVYMLNENASAVEIRFTLNSQSDSFGENSDVIIEKPLEINGSTEYRRIAASDFGVNGYSVFLEEGSRYRISVRNENGDIRVLGGYQPTISETVQLEPGALSISVPDDGGVNYEARYSNETGPEITFEYVDPDNATSSVQVEIHERGNESNVLMENTTYDSGPYGTLRVTETLTANQSEEAWVVKWHANRDGDDDIGSGILVGAHEGNLLDEVMAPWMQLWLAVGITLMTGGLFSRANVGIGAIGTAAVGGFFWYFGWTNGVTSGMAVVVALGGAVIINYSGKA